MAEPQKHFLARLEEDILKTWEKEKTFEKSLENRQGRELFSFYDGPPFANGLPHYGHFVQTTIKDAVTRYKTMQGYYVPRRVGWDTHGLPVEYAIEKEHQFRGKQDIVAYGIDKFNTECRESVFRYQDVWEDMFRRVGRWADYSKTYATFDEAYIESVWWVFKTIYEKELVYKAFRSTPYCPRCATPLSNFELNQGYQDDVEDPSLFIKFKIVGQEASLLAWTTTPWSLPGNAAVAVNPKASYVYVELKDDDDQTETLILARDRLSSLNAKSYHISKEVKGVELVGLSYEPLFKLTNLSEYANTVNLYRVWPAEFVSIEEGSGVLHVAPAFGEDDLQFGNDHELPILLTIDDFGKVVTGVGLPADIEGTFFKKADAKIIEYLTRHNRVYAVETIKHTYPFCWRCDTPLLYYATNAWMIKVASLRDSLVSNNQKINWVPEHIRDGRFGKWLENARDWSISRNRFWGAPIPVWETEDGEIVVIGSLAELKDRAVNLDSVADLHRPYIDNVEITTDSGKIAHRIAEVFDCWFESGSMPYAQDHYPFENKNNWTERYPATFVAEAIDQTRGWFYTLHVLATVLFDKPAFLNVICSGWIVAADGEKLSKRKKNYAPMDEVFDQFGVDTLRFFMASSPIVNGEDVRFSVDYLRDTQRKVFMTLYNSYSFYKLYADVDNWQPTRPLAEPQSDSVLDQWMISRLNGAIKQVTEALDSYRLDKAARPLADLLDDLSNWFVRRSRRRFWKSENDIDKQNAYETLHYTLLRLCQLLAPFAPFLTDYIWRQLIQETTLPVSVHLSDWPKAGKINQQLLDDMNLARQYITIGLAQRAAVRIKVRQPLALAEVPELPEHYKAIIAEELNVKAVTWGNEVTLDTNITPELKSEGLIRELIRQIQSLRKEAGFEVSDRIRLSVGTKGQEVELALFAKDKIVAEAIKSFKDQLYREILAVEGPASTGQVYSKELDIEGHRLEISVEKA
ncbi:MAG: isoleucine--tRNA ligase [Candidatus Saccharimonadales bacterium]